MTKNSNKPRKIVKNYEFRVAGLILVSRKDFTIHVEPLNVRSDIQQKIIELAGLN